MNGTRISGEELIHSLSMKIDGLLSLLIPRVVPCALIDFPNYSNVGDSAIWLGETKWLRKNRNPIVYVCDKDTYSPDVLAEHLGQGIILLQGGGNFGDLWWPHQHLRERVIQDFPENKIIQLPQTIFFSDDANLIRARQILNAHSNLTL